MLTASGDPARFEAALTEAVTRAHGRRPGRGTKRTETISDLPAALSGEKASELVLVDAAGADAPG